MFAFNVLLLMFVGNGYLASVPKGTSLLGWLVTLLAFTANFTMIAIVPAILVLPTLLTRRAWVTLGAAVLLFGCVGFFIYADSVIYRLWRFHFNGMVFNLLTTPGAGDTVTAGKGTVKSAVAVALLIYAAEIGFVVWLLPAVRRLRVTANLRSSKAMLLCFCSVAGLILLDKVSYDVGDLRDDPEVIRIRNVLPFYQTVTVKRFANRVLGLNVTPDTRWKLRKTSGALDYPRAPIRFHPGGPRPNVVVIALEGARFDMLRPDVMPLLSHWGEQHLVLENHFSAGNTTRYGIFGLIYGIYGTYWPRALAEHQGPVLIRALKGLDYHFCILCCTDLNYPEFRSTCFIDVPEAVTDHWNCDRVDRDKAMTDEFIKFVGEKKQPFFAFMFYDASHQPYRYPREHAVFDTGDVTDEINYVKLARQGKTLEVDLLRNRYKNSLHYVDAQIGRALQALEQNALLDNTLVFIVGDHGEEFGECGSFGHDSAFHRYQTKTVAVAHIPGVPPQRIQRLTSHHDIAPTVLSYMGAENPLADYTQGQPLTAKTEPPFAFISSWSEAAVVDRKGIVEFGLAAYRADMTVLTSDNVPLPNQRGALAERSGELLEAMNGMSQFDR